MAMFIFGTCGQATQKFAKQPEAAQIVELELNTSNLVKCQNFWC